MDYLSTEFLIFIFSFLLIYFKTCKLYRYIIIFVGSYVFYGYFDYRMCFVLAAVTVVTYLGGLIIQKYKKRTILVFLLCINVMLLGVYKYAGFIVQNINILRWLFNRETIFFEIPNIILPVGLSFIVFQSTTYLMDVWRGYIEVEKNVIRYGAFVAFFPTVLSGPIQKARELLPQIRYPKDFDGESAKKGTILFVWGMFEKIMVSSRLSSIVSMVYDNYKEYDSAYYIVATLSFSLYIYADFSSYSDMARGIAQIMGIEVGKNFKNPYLSLSTSEFWNKWHVSLNSWFTENIYIPLGGNRKGTPRKYINIFIVFFISGIWHGGDYHYIFWGGVNGAIVIIGHCLKPIRNKVYDRLHLDQTLESIIFLKRALTFSIISLTWIFFYNGLVESFYILKEIIFFDPIDFFNVNLLSISGTAEATFLSMVSTAFFCWIQIKRKDENAFYAIYKRQPLLLQCTIIAMLIGICMFAICVTGTNVDKQFMYFQF